MHSINNSYINGFVHFGVSTKKEEKPVLNDFAKRELEMIPKYLELADNKGDSRFNDEEIQSISEAFENYHTEASRVDILKEILSVGKNKDNLLSVKDIIGVLSVTSGMSEEEQKNVIKFIKASRDIDTKQIIVKSIKERYSYEDFKERESSSDLSEDQMRESYETDIDKRWRILATRSYQNMSEYKRPDSVGEIVNGKNPIFLRAVASSSNPEKLAEVVEYTGINNAVSISANDLLSIYDMTNENGRLIRDISKIYVVEEIRQISSALKDQKEKGTLSSDIKYDYFDDYINHSTGLYKTSKLRNKRVEILKALNIDVSEDEVRKLPRAFTASEDVYISGAKISYNFERGKKSK